MCAFCIGLFYGISEASDKLADTRRAVEDKNGDEFISADPCGDLAFVHYGFQTVGDPFQCFISGCVSEIIVNVFQTIHIDAGNGDRIIFEFSVCKIPGDALLKTTTVE